MSPGRPRCRRIISYRFCSINLDGGVRSRDVVKLRLHGPNSLLSGKIQRITSISLRGYTGRGSCWCEFPGVRSIPADRVRTPEQEINREPDSRIRDGRETPSLSSLDSGVCKRLWFAGNCRPREVLLPLEKSLRSPSRRLRHSRSVVRADYR